MSRNRGNRRGGRRGPRSQSQDNSELKEPSTGSQSSGKSKGRNSRAHINYPICPLCGKSVRYLLTAFPTGADNAPTHFDCVLRKINSEEQTGNREKVAYLGNGAFGVIRFNNNAKSGFTIKKRIPFEKPDHRPVWRKNIGSGIRD
jgi:hypothetical protein